MYSPSAPLALQMPLPCSVYWMLPGPSAGMLCSWKNGQTWKHAAIPQRRPINRQQSLRKRHINHRLQQIACELTWPSTRLVLQELPLFAIVPLPTTLTLTAAGSQLTRA